MKFRTLVGHYKAVFSSPAGEGVLRDLLRRFHMLRPSYEPGMDAAELAFREGQRSVVTHVLTMLRLNERDLDTILQSMPVMEEEDHA